MTAMSLCCLFVLSGLRCPVTGLVTEDDHCIPQTLRCERKNAPCFPSFSLDHWLWASGDESPRPVLRWTTEKPRSRRRGRHSAGWVKPELRTFARRLGRPGDGRLGTSGTAEARRSGPKSGVQGPGGAALRYLRPHGPEVLITFIAAVSDESS